MRLFYFSKNLWNALGLLELPEGHLEHALAPLERSRAPGTDPPAPWNARSAHGTPHRGSWNRASGSIWNCPKGSWNARRAPGTEPPAPWNARSAHGTPHRGSWNRALGSTWNALGHLEQSLRLYLERALAHLERPLGAPGTEPPALGTVLPSRGVRGVLERALAHYRLPDAIHDIADIIVRHIRTGRQAEADLEDGF